MAQLDLHIATIGPPVEIPGNDLKNLWFLRLSFCLGYTSLRIQICPEKGIEPRILLWGWDWDHQTYSRDGSGFLGHVGTVGCKRKKFQTIFSQMVVGFLLIFILWDRIRTKNPEQQIQGDHLRKHPAKLTSQNRLHWTLRMPHPWQKPWRL